MLIAKYYTFLFQCKIPTRCKSKHLENKSESTKPRFGYSLITDVKIIYVTQNMMKNCWELNRSTIRKKKLCTKPIGSRLLFANKVNKINKYKYFYTFLICIRVCTSLALLVRSLLIPSLLAFTHSHSRHTVVVVAAPIVVLSSAVAVPVPCQPDPRP